MIKNVFKKIAYWFSKEKCYDDILSCPFYNHTDIEDGELTEKHFELLDFLHKQKISMSDAIFVVNPGKYFGTSTMNEILYASKNGKEIMYLE